ncbi:MAG: orotate phosphoribosyltransferase [Acidimicrobiales bacterium]
MAEPAPSLQVAEVAHLTGSFTLRSGQEASAYFDKFHFRSRPHLLAEVADELAALLPPEIELVAGLQLGGVPLAATLALRTGLPAVHVRLERKAYGTGRITEGIDVSGRQVAVVEDVVTTGGQIALSTEDLRREGAAVGHALAVVDREVGGRENLRRSGLELRSVFTTADLVAVP